MFTKWIPWKTTHGPVEIRVEWPAENDQPNRLYIRRDREKYVSLPTDEFLDKYQDLTEAIESESRILFR